MFVNVGRHCIKDRLSLTSYDKYVYSLVYYTTLYYWLGGMHLYSFSVDGSN